MRICTYITESNVSYSSFSFLLDRGPLRQHFFFSSFSGVSHGVDLKKKMRRGGVNKFFARALDLSPASNKLMELGMYGYLEQVEYGMSQITCPKKPKNPIFSHSRKMRREMSGCCPYVRVEETWRAGTFRAGSEEDCVYVCRYCSLWERFK